MVKDYRQCTCCILDTKDDPAMTFDANGQCTYCQKFDIAWQSIPKTEEESKLLFGPIIEKLKSNRKNNKYDCLLGISGGVDSTYLALLLKTNGVNPLVIHFDNGWNSGLAVANIENIVTKLGFDLETVVIDWDEFRALQLAYLRASVVDIEVLTDHAIYGSMYKIAHEHKIKYVISGVNVATENVLCSAWIYDKLDHVNIKSIYKQYGTTKLDSYPFVDEKVRRIIQTSGIETIRLLDTIVYDLSKAKQEIQAELNWRPYEGKHFESIFTRFYQGYILPRKFHINKRKAHLSNLICSGQMLRAEAMQALDQTNYDDDQVNQDMEFVLKKLKLSREEFEQIMNLPIRKHSEFDQMGSFFSRFPIARPLRPLWQKIRPVLKPQRA